MQCPMCRSYFEPKRSDQGYCSAKCNKLGSILEGRRGRRVYRALYHWRLPVVGEDGKARKGPFGANMKFVCREIASWIREDRLSQRLPPPPHNHDSDRGHEREPQGVTL